MNLKSASFKGFALTLVLAGAASSQALVSFDFTYTDAGIGFNDPTLGATRRDSLQRAAGYVSSVLGSSYTATITYSVNGAQSGPNTLASAGSNINSTYSGPGFGLQGDVMTKILGGADPSAGFDGQVNWNFASFDWGYTTVSNTQYDFISTAIHELTHSIGFFSAIQQNGNSLFGQAPGTPAEFGSYDRYLADASGNLITSGGVLDGPRFQAAQTSNGGLFFNGPNAVAANGGQLVSLYSPTTYEPGSSVSHLNDNVFSEALYIMDAQTPPGLGPQVYTPLEIGMLKDLGYTNAAQPVPEPATLAALGLGALALLKRRRKNG